MYVLGEYPRMHLASSTELRLGFLSAWQGEGWEAMRKGWSLDSNQELSRGQSQKLGERTGQLCSLPPQDRAKIWCELAYVLFTSVSLQQRPPSSTLHLTHEISEISL